MSAVEALKKPPIHIGPLTVTALGLETNFTTLIINEKEMSLTPRVSELLAFLADRANQWVSKATLYEELWDQPRPHHKAIDVLVCKLREVITKGLVDPLPQDMHYLVSNGYGAYMLSSELRRLTRTGTISAGQPGNVIENLNRLRYAIP